MSELLLQARKLYQKAMASEDPEERKDLEAQADDLLERGKIEQKMKGIEIPDDPMPPKANRTGEGTKLADLMANSGYTDDQISAVLKSLGNTEGQWTVDVGKAKKDYDFRDFLVAVRNGDRKALKAMGSKKDMTEGDGTSGGYLVPTESRGDLLRVPDSAAVVRPRARKIPMKRRSLTMPMLDQGSTPAAYWKLDYYAGVLSYWTEEGGAKTESEPEFKQMELVAHKLAGYTQVSDELLADSGQALGPLLTSLFRGTITMREDFAFLRGTGVGEPMGILNSPVLVTQNRAVSNDIYYRDLTRMLGNFLPSSYGNATWVASYLALPYLLTMEDGAGNNVFIPNATGGVTQRIPGTILGRPLVVTEKVPSIGNTGDVMLCDFTYYILGDRQSISIQSSEHYDFVKDLTTWRFTHRVDGQPWLDAPIYTDTTNTVSPFVALHQDST